MKDIKFRAKKKNTRDWVYGELHLKSIHPHIHNDFVHKVNINSDTVGQFIGRKDKNQVEIYDGDIFQFAPSENGTVVHKFLVRVSEYLIVEIRDLDYPEKSRPFSYMSKDWWEYFQDEIEVIGNIYDNPELIK